MKGTNLSCQMIKYSIALKIKIEIFSCASKESAWELLVLINLLLQLLSCLKFNQCPKLSLILIVVEKFSSIIKSVPELTEMQASRNGSPMRRELKNHKYLTSL